MHSDDPRYTAWREGCVSVPVLRVPAVVPHEVINYLVNNSRALEGLALAYPQRQELLERTQAFWSALMELASLDPYCAADHATELRPGACPQRSEDSRLGAARSVPPLSNTGINKGEA